MENTEEAMNVLMKEVQKAERQSNALWAAVRDGEDSETRSQQLLLFFFHVGRINALYQAIGVLAPCLVKDSFQLVNLHAKRFARDAHINRTK